VHGHPVIIDVHASSEQEGLTVRRRGTEVDPHPSMWMWIMPGMTPNGAGATPEEIETYDQLLAALDGLRIGGARGQQKLRLSVRDVAGASGVPRSSVASYLTGKVVMPYDQFNAIVTSLGITADQLPGWEGANR
jgi:hypothetical protein